MDSKGNLGILLESEREKNNRTRKLEILAVATKKEIDKGYFFFELEFKDAGKLSTVGLSNCLVWVKVFREVAPRISKTSGQTGLGFWLVFKNGRQEKEKISL